MNFKKVARTSGFPRVIILRPSYSRGHKVRVCHATVTVWMQIRVSLFITAAFIPLKYLK